MKLKLPHVRIPIGGIWTGGLVVAIRLGYLTFDRWRPRAHAWVEAKRFD